MIISYDDDKELSLEELKVGNVYKSAFNEHLYLCAHIDCGNKRVMRLTNIASATSAPYICGPNSILKFLEVGKVDVTFNET